MLETIENICIIIAISCYMAMLICLVIEVVLDIDIDI